HVALHGRGQPARERRRPDRARGGRVALPGGRRPAGRHPLEGHLRAARVRDRRDGARRLHPRGHHDQERLAARMHNDAILVIVVGTALAFDYTNGFHDTANAVATMVSTRAMAPRVAVLYAAMLNFAGAFISLKVAATVAKDFVEPSSVTPEIIFGGLIGAIAWNIATWYFGLPSSSSHALIGGVVGSVLVAAGGDAIEGANLVSKLLIPALIAPVLAFAVAALA